MPKQRQAAWVLNSWGRQAELDNIYSSGFHGVVSSRSANSRSRKCGAALLHECDSENRDVAIHQSRLSDIPLNSNGTWRKTLSVTASQKNVLDPSDFKDFHSIREVNRVEIRQMLQASLNKGAHPGVSLSRKERALQIGTTAQQLFNNMRKYKSGWTSSGEKSYI